MSDSTSSKIAAFWGVMAKKTESKSQPKEAGRRGHLRLVHSVNRNEEERPVEGAGPSEENPPEELKLPEIEQDKPEGLEPVSDEIPSLPRRPGKKTLIGNR